jgi:mono/diheme cytochrome c family protein
MSTTAAFKKAGFKKSMRIGVRVAAVLVALLVIGIGALWAYVQINGSPRFEMAPTGITASDDPAVIARGRYLAHGPMHCSTCHAATRELATLAPVGEELALSGGQVWDIPGFGLFRARNLTSHQATGIGALTDEEVARAIKHGVAADGSLQLFMSFANAAVPDEELRALVSYLRTLAPVENAVPVDEHGIMGRAMIAFGVMGPNEATPPAYVAMGPEPSVARGEYLARGPARCAGCHSPFDMLDGNALKGELMSGCLQPEPGRDAPELEGCAPNLTPHPTRGHINTWSEDDFVARFSLGTGHSASVMPWRDFATLTEVDKRSLYRWLGTLPPADRDVGPPIREVGSWPAG